jgi:hypothetical protein
MRGAETPLRFHAATIITYITPANTRPNKIRKASKLKGKSEDESTSTNPVSVLLLPFTSGLFTF